MCIHTRMVDQETQLLLEQRWLRAPAPKVNKSRQKSTHHAKSQRNALARNNFATPSGAALAPRTCTTQAREFFIDNLLVRIHLLG